MNLPQSDKNKQRGKKCSVFIGRKHGEGFTKYVKWLYFDLAAIKSVTDLIHVPVQYKQWHRAGSEWLSASNWREHKHIVKS